MCIHVRTWLYSGRRHLRSSSRAANDLKQPCRDSRGTYARDGDARSDGGARRGRGGGGGEDGVGGEGDRADRADGHVCTPVGATAGTRRAALPSPRPRPRLRARPRLQAPAAAPAAAPGASPPLPSADEHVWGSGAAGAAAAAAAARDAVAAAGVARAARLASCRARRCALAARRAGATRRRRAARCSVRALPAARWRRGGGRGVRSQGACTRCKVAAGSAERARGPGRQPRRCQSGPALWAGPRSIKPSVLGVDGRYTCSRFRNDLTNVSK